MIGHFNSAEARFRLDAVPLNKAAYLSIGRLLLDSGLDPNLADLLTGETALFDAIRCNDKDMVALLLNYVSLSLSLSLSGCASDPIRCLIKLDLDLAMQSKQATTTL